jgi:uncharacterized protein (DUF1810 family)
MLIIQAPLYSQSISFLRRFTPAKTEYWFVTGRLMALQQTQLQCYSVTFLNKLNQNF